MYFNSSIVFCIGFFNQSLNFVKGFTYSTVKKSIQYRKLLYVSLSFEQYSLVTNPATLDISEVALAVVIATGAAPVKTKAVSEAKESQLMKISLTIAKTSLYSSL